MTILDYLYNFRETVNIWLAPNLWWLQILALFFSALFLWGIIYIVLKVNYLNMKTEQFINILASGRLSRRRSLKGWKQILKRAASEDPQQWKIAILEADRILDEILKMSGYLGKMEEKLDLVTSAQLSNIEDVKNAHRLSNQIANDPTLILSPEAAQQALNIYKQAFAELNLISE